MFLCYSFVKFLVLLNLKKYLEITRTVIKGNLLSATIHLGESEFSSPKCRKNLDVDSSLMNP